MTDTNKITPDEMLKAYVERLRNKKAMQPDTMVTCPNCGHTDKFIMFDVKPFSDESHPLAIRKGNNYHCPTCKQVVYSEVTLLS